MRITPPSKNLPVGPAQPAQTDKPAGSSGSASSDSVELSALSQTASSGLAFGRAEELQAQVEAGTYQTNPTEISRRMIDFYLLPV